MATNLFESKVAGQDGTSSNEFRTKGAIDTLIADAKNRANHTGSQTVSTLSDFESAVDARVQLIVDAAPAALDTLNEIAAALGDDPDFAGTITTSLGAIDSRLDDLEAATGAGGYKETYGDAVASSFVLTHNLGSYDVRVEVVRQSDKQTVYPVVTRTSTNAVTVDHGSSVPGSNAYRALITLVP